MNIKEITPAPKVSDRPAKIAAPIYLVVAEDLRNDSKIQKYLATKLDEQQYSVRIIGVETNEKENKIEVKYQEIINSCDRSLYIEMTLPWQRVICIRNLTYKPKL